MSVNEIADGISVGASVSEGKHAGKPMPHKALTAPRRGEIPVAAKFARNASRCRGSPHHRQSYQQPVDDRQCRKPTYPKSSVGAKYQDDEGWRKRISNMSRKDHGMRRPRLKVVRERKSFMAQFTESRQHSHRQITGCRRKRRGYSRSKVSSDGELGVVDGDPVIWHGQRELPRQARAG